MGVAYITFQEFKERKQSLESDDQGQGSLEIYLKIRNIWIYVEVPYIVSNRRGPDLKRFDEVGGKVDCIGPLRFKTHSRRHLGTSSRMLTIWIVSDIKDVSKRIG